MGWSRALAAAAAVTVALAARVAAAETPSPAVCSVNVGDPVMLRSSDFDPDVLVWDSRERAIDYAGGNVRSATDVLTHTLLSRPGTRAIVVACLPNTVKPKYSNDSLDTVGVKITNGPQRGRYGWVTSDDVRDNRSSQASAAP